MSTVGSASATESVGGRTTTTTTTDVGGDNSTLGEDRDEDMLTEMDSVSTKGYMGGDAMDEELDNLTSRSVGGYEDRMSDDGTASLVGFGEGAGSTLSGPIYHRRALPSQGSAGPGAAAALWGLERSNSGLSDGVSGRRDLAARASDRDTSTGTDTPVSQSAVRERREARMMDGVAMDSTAPSVAQAATDAGAADDDVFVDTTTRGPIPLQQSPPTAAHAARERQQQQQRHPHLHAHRQQHQHHNQHGTPQQPQQPHPNSTSSPTTREAAERIVRETLGEGEARPGATALGSTRTGPGSGGGERLGRFYFEDR